MEPNRDRSCHGAAEEIWDLHSDGDTGLSPHSHPKTFPYPQGVPRPSALLAGDSWVEMAASWVLR